MMPVRCARCGATIDPLALACPYCKLTTPAGVADRQRREYDARVRADYEARASHHQAWTQQAKIASTATQSLVLSLVGIVLCCVPTGIAGIVQGVRARSMAAALKMPPPARATIGLVLGIVSIVTSIAFIVYIEIDVSKDKARADERIAQLEQTVGPRAASSVLAQDVACGLAEQYVLRNGFDGNRGYTFTSFECVGRVSGLSAERAQLSNFRFTRNSSDKSEVSVCFTHGAKWFVAELKRGACPP